MKNLEIERKFLVKKEIWSGLVKPPGILYYQGYLTIDAEKIIRVRVAGEKGVLTIKGKSDMFSHPEFEYFIPLEEAIELIDKYTGNRVEKLRYRIPSGRYTFEVDEFSGRNKGLLIAEIELDKPDAEFDKPEWLGGEVTGDERYFNAYLSLHPFCEWKNKNLF